MGFRNLSNSKRSVTKADDVSGLKVRVMANPVALDTWKTIGANAVPMAFAEVFPALEIKALDGQENPLLHMYANKMQEVQKYISLTNHVYTPVAHGGVEEVLGHAVARPTRRASRRPPPRPACCSASCSTKATPT